jgi:hypothetical protein
VGPLRRLSTLRIFTEGVGWVAMQCLPDDDESYLDCRLVGAEFVRAGLASQFAVDFGLDARGADGKLSPQRRAELTDPLHIRARGVMWHAYNRYYELTCPDWCAHCTG